jgi:2-oxoglutarate ferredoxin oxidoreductase subunit beta
VLATLLAQMQPPVYPVALGVIYCEEGPEYSSAVYDQVAAAKAKKKALPLNDLLHSGHTWRVGA